MELAEQLLIISKLAKRYDWRAALVKKSSLNS